MKKRTITRTKRCAMCSTFKPLSEFGRNRARHDGVSVYCRPCKAQEQAARWASNPAHYNASNRKSRVKQKYGLTLEQLEAMKAERDGRCDICGRKKHLVVDHDHKTGKIRGLICGDCNRGLGFLGDTADAVLRAWKYLSSVT